MVHIIFLRNRRELEEHWGEAEPLLGKCVRHAVRGEFSTEDIAEMVRHGAAVIALVFEAGTAIFAAAFETVRYPSGLVCGNIMAVGGRDLSRIWLQFEAPILEYFRRVGAQFVECSCSPAMERLLRRSGRWHEAYRVLRMEI